MGAGMKASRSDRPAKGIDDVYERIYQSPKFHELVHRRSTFAAILAAIMLSIYYGFILLVAFGKGFLAVRVGGGVTTVGILVAIAVIVSAFVLTAIYVYRANGEFDALSNELRDEVAR